MARLGQVNANLVRPPGLQPALQQRVAVEEFQRADVGHRPLADAGQRRAAAAFVAPVADEVRDERLRLDAAQDDRLVDAADLVLAEHLHEPALGLGARARIIRPLVSRSRRWTARTRNALAGSAWLAPRPAASAASSGPGCGGRSRRGWAESAAAAAARIAPRCDGRWSRRRASPRPPGGCRGGGSLRPRPAAGRPAALARL